MPTNKRLMDRLQTILHGKDEKLSSYGSLQSLDYMQQRIRRASSALPIKKPINDLAVMANTLNALFGASLFAMPWGFSKSGVLGGLVVLTLVAYVSFETARLLLISQRLHFERTDEVIGYPELARLALGPQWFYIVQGATIISCLGGCTGYMIFFGQTMAQIFSTSSKVILIIAAIPVVLLSWIRSFEELGYFSIIGIFTLLASCLLILYEGSSEENQKTITSVSLFLPKSILQFVGTTTFSFTIHYCILSIGEETLKMEQENELRDIQRERIENLVFNERLINKLNSDQLINPIALAFGFATIVNFVVGSGAFILYSNVPFVRNIDGEIMDGCEDHVCQNIILNLNPGILSNLVGLSMSLVLLLSYIILLAPAREHVENIIFSYWTPPSEKIQNFAMNTIRAILVLSTISIGILAPYFGSVVGTIGGLTDTLQCFLIPPMIYMVFFKTEATKTNNWFYNCIIFWGVCIMIYTIINTLNSILSMAANINFGFL